MAKILIGLALHKPDRRFLESMSSFLPSIQHHEGELLEIMGKPLVDAQNMMADKMKAGDYEYLLTIEEDHSGFTAQMLDDMIAANKPVVAIPYYSRHFPYYTIPCNKHKYRDDLKQWDYKGAKHTSGLHKCDLMGFGFTLIKREVIDKIPSPVFRRNENHRQSTDRNFCNDLKKHMNTRPWGLFDHFIYHRGLHRDNRMEFLQSLPAQQVDYLRKRYAVSQTA